MCTRGWNCHLSIPDVLTDGLGRPLVWIAVAAATGLMMREKLASSHDSCDFAGKRAGGIAFAEPIP